MSSANRKPRGEKGDWKGKAGRSEASSIVNRELPYDLTAEKAVLGCVILNSEVINELSLILRADDFYDDAHRILYEAMVDLFNSGKKVDVALLVNQW